MMMSGLVLVIVAVCCSTMGRIAHASEIESGPPAPPVGRREINDRDTWIADRKLAERILETLCGSGARYLESDREFLASLCKHNGVSPNNIRSERSHDSPPQEQRHIIFVEVPVIEKPRAPETTVYVLPPEESHVYRVFDMRSGRKPTVQFLSSG